ncbi:adenylate kinase 4, mitochondrial [Rhinoderma darwinii]|uniref:adenylate kinase 4, mitochondrial n=1 Tax=Rhinoderma darwinii TaxID=43563 RepID=UPI003F67A859
MASKLLRAVILGPPGSGKGTVCQRIAKNFGLQHLSSGDFLRQNIRSNTETGVLAKQYMKEGLPVPDNLITRVMLSELEKKTTHSWLLDGFPRTVVQAEALDKICDLDLVITLNIPFETLKDRLNTRWVHLPSGRVYNLEFNPPQVHEYNYYNTAPIYLVITLNIPFETLKDRLNTRWVHLPSGRVYNLEFNPPQVHGIDDVTGEPLVRQEDDKPDAVVARLRQYKDVAKPVMERYKSKGTLHTFSGTETNKIWPYIYTLMSHRITPVHPEDTSQAFRPEAP